MASVLETMIQSRVLSRIGAWHHSDVIFLNNIDSFAVQASRTQAVTASSRCWSAHKQLASDGWHFVSVDDWLKHVTAHEGSSDTTFVSNDNDSVGLATVGTTALQSRPNQVDDFMMQPVPPSRHFGRTEYVQEFH